jgi:uncharacterized protein
MMIRRIEHRATSGLSVRADQASEESAAPSRTVRGLAAVYNVRADIGGMFTEEIAPGAFTRSIAETDIRALYQHDMGQVLGRMSAGTLRATDTARGVEVEIDLPESRQDVLEAIARGDIDGMSIGFRVRADRWEGQDTDTPHRTITEVELMEVSPVTWPAYIETEIGVRSTATAIEAAEQVLQTARDEARAASVLAENEQRAQQTRMTVRLMEARL